MLHGRFSDGVSPIAHDAEVTRTESGLLIAVPRLNTRVLWSFEEVHWEKLGVESRLTRIQQEVDTGARLSLNTAMLEREFADDLRRFRTRRAGEAGATRIAMWSVGAIASLAFILLIGLPFFARVAAPLIPYSWEVKLGESVEKDVLEMVSQGKSPRFCTAPGTPGRAALDEMILRLTASLPLQGPLKVDIVDVNMTNAFALPGGRIFLFREVIEKATSADEVAGVLAHEIGHVVHRHSMRAVLHDGALSVLVGLVLGDVTGGTSIAILGQMMLGSAFSRDQERESDEVSVRLMQEAGADPRAINVFFRRLLKADGSEGGTATFRSHPLTTERIENVDRLANEALPPKRPILSPAQWAALKNACQSGA
ncbi:MAG: M48 family metallopeptidase [Rhabdaerophilum sp.]